MKRGNCYTTTEALFHLLGGKASGWKPMYVKHEGDTHWYLQHMNGTIIDATKAQFKKPVPYTQGRGCGFLTKQPSKRAVDLMRRLVWQQ